MRDWNLPVRGVGEGTTAERPHPRMCIGRRQVWYMGLLIWLSCVGLLVGMGSGALGQEVIPGQEEASKQAASRAVEVSSGAGAGLTERSLDWLLEEASQSWEAGDYPRTSELYRVVLEKGIRNGSIHFNLGNALLRQGELGAALHQYRLAQLFLPRDGDVEANLQYARQKRTDRLELPTPEPIERMLFWLGSTSHVELHWLALLGAACFWVLLAAQRWNPRWRLRIPVGLALLATLLAGGSAFYQGWRLTNMPDAVVLEPTLSVRSGTDKGSVVLFTLHAGAEVRTRGVQADWVQLELSEGKRGWVEQRFVGLVR